MTPENTEIKNETARRIFEEAEKIKTTFTDLMDPVWAAKSHYVDFINLKQICQSQPPSEMSARELVEKLREWRESQSVTSDAYNYARRCGIHDVIELAESLLPQKQEVKESRSYPSLLPCPMCGGEVRLIDPNAGSGMKVAMTYPRYPYCDECGISFNSDKERSELKIARRYNMRAPITPPQQKDKEEDVES